jgi:hypothetical protein
VRYGSWTCDGQIVDLSAIGMRVSVHRSVEMPVGWNVEILSEALGAMTAVVQWQRPGSFGVKLELSSNTRAKVEAVWKNFMAAGLASQGATSSPPTARVTTVRR